VDGSFTDSFKTDRSRGVPVSDPYYRGEAAETGESDARYEE